MAIKVKVTADNGIVTEYHRIALLSIDTNNQNTILVHSYLGEAGRQVEKDYAAVTAKMDALAVKLEKASGSEASAISKQIYDEYVSYYRSRVKYVMENSKSLTSVPVFYQVLGDNLPVFGQMTDAIHFNNICK